MFYALIDTEWFSFLFPVLLLSSIVIGHFLAKRREKKTGRPAGFSGVESAVIGFFALLISFTLASAGNSYKERISLIHQQSSHLAQLYRAAMDKPDSVKASVAQFLLTHIKIQTTNSLSAADFEESTLQQIGNNNARFLEQMKQSGQLQAMLPVFNSVSDQTYKLVYSYDERLPQVLMFLLVLASLLIAVLVGFMNRSNVQRHYLTSFIYLVLVVLTLQAIRDLNNPFTGNIKPGYKNLLSVGEMIRLENQKANNN